MKIIIRADANSHIGMGHFSRCRILCEALNAAGAECQLVALRNRVTETYADIDTVVLIDTESEFFAMTDVGLCIVDTYEYSEAYYRKIMSDRICMIDDIEFCMPTSVDAVINFQCYAMETDYVAGKSFCGPTYYPMRKEFFTVAAESNKENIFICMGGSDPEGQTKRLGRLLIDHTERDIDMVFGLAYDDADTVNEFLKNDRVNVHIGPKNISTIMSGCQFAVSGAGGMLYELAFLGVPSMAVVLADNQQRIAKSFNEKGISINLGDHKQMTDADVLSAIAVMNDDTKRREMVLRAQAVIDGKGAERLSRDILEWMTS